jgi:hypothetical protein
MKTATFTRLIVLSLALASRICISSELPFGPPDVPAAQPVNAMWSNENAFLILSVYAEKSQCPKTRRNAKSVLTIAPGRRLADTEWTNLIVQEIPLCMHTTWDQTTTMCQTGEVRFQYFEAEQEYRGDYNLALSNGVKMRGSFRAKYCPVGK